MPVDPTVHPLEAESTAGHNNSTTREETNPAWSVEYIENRIRIPAIVLVAFFHPEPVRDGNATTNAKSRKRRYSVWWREEEQVEDEGYRRRGVEGDVGRERDPGCPIWQD